MLDDIFNLESLNIIQDEDNYYLFRALNNGDYSDIVSGITSDDGLVKMIRTDRERYTGTPLYSEDDEISLEEIHDHIKYVHRKDTNCISLSTNTVVSLTYGKGYYHNQYAMIKIPKDKFEANEYYFAGKILIEEINKRIDTMLKSGVLTSDRVEMLKKIDEAKTKDELLHALEDYSNLKTNSYTFSKSKYYDFLSLNDVQNFEKNKILAKLDIVGRKLLSRSSNTMLLETLKFAFTSCEMLHYKNITEDFQLVSPLTIDLFSLLQQAKCMGINQDKIDILESKILECAKKGIELNDSRYGEYNTLINNGYDTYNDIKIEDVYKLTGGRIPYSKAKRAYLFTKSVANSKIKTSNLCELLKEIIDDSSYDEVIDEIREKCYVVDPNFISLNKQNGLQLCDSTCLDINMDSRAKVFSAAEQKSLLEYINSLDDEQKRTFIESTNLDDEKKLCELLSDTYEDETSLNTYYAEIILDYLDLDEVYKNSYLEKVLTVEERDILISYLDKANCIKMFEELSELNIEPKKISGIIFNLLLNNGYQGLNYIDLSNSEDFKNIISDNLDNIDSSVSAVRMDYLLGIRDDDNLVPETNMVLRDYQKLAVDRVNDIFNTKNYAGVVLPTGAGKSFVAIAEMLRYSDKNILYYAPNREILRQIQKHIVKHVLNLNIIPESQEAYYYEHSNEIPEDYIFQNDIEDMIAAALPHLKMYCYQGLTTKEDEFFSNKNAGLIVLDEVHRTGAKEWNEKIKLLLEKNPKAKILAITATPVRDVDNQNMVEKLAEFTGMYSKEEIIQKKYMASEMYLVDAMQEGIVVTPNIVTFDYYLGDSPQFKEAKELYDRETNPDKKEKLKQSYDNMRKIVEASQKKGLSKIIKEAFENNKKSSNGRYIIFLPPNNTKMPTEEYMLQQMEIVKEYFKDIDEEPEMEYLLSSRKQKSANSHAISRFENETGHLKLLFAINMLNEGVHVDGIDGVMMLRPLGVGNKIMYYQQIGRCIYSLDPNHELEPSEFPVIFDVYNNYLSQNIDRQINRHTITSDLQKMRQIQDWISKHQRFPDINSESKSEAKKAVTLKRIQQKYIKYVEESIKNDSLTESEIYEIKEIIEIGIDIDLWNKEIPKQLLKTKGSEKIVDKITTFEARGEQKQFLELFKNMGKVAAADSKELRKMKLIDTINILDVLAEYEFNINCDTIPLECTMKDIYSQLDENTLELVKETIEVDDDFAVGRCFDDLKKEFGFGNSMFLDYDIKTLRKMGIFTPVQNRIYYKLLYQSVDEKGFLIDGPKKFRNLNIYTGTYYGEDGFDIDGKDENNFTKDDGYINKYNFDRDGYYYEIDEDGNYVKTDSIYNPYGFDVKGDCYQLQDDGSYVNIGKLDPYGFDIDGFYHTYNSATGEYIKTKFFLDDNYFDRDGLYWSPIGENLGPRKRKLTYADGEQVIFEDVLYYSRKSNGSTKPNVSSRIPTNLPYDLNYFDRDGYYYCLNENGERVKSKFKYNERYLDADSYYYALQPDGTRVKTDREYDDNYYSLDRHYYKLQEDGTRVRTDYVIDIDGLNCPGLIVKYRYDPNTNRNSKAFAFDENGYLYNYIDGKFVKADPPTKVSKYGFDREGYYHKKLKDGTWDENPTNSKNDKYGFNEDGIYCYSEGRTENPYVNAMGFSQDGYFWVKGKKKKRLVKTNSKVDEFGFDIDKLFNFKKSDGTYVKRLYNQRFLSRDGYYYKRVQQEDGTYIRVKTNRKVDIRGFDLSGNHFDRFVNPSTGEEIYKNPMPYDKRGFDVDGIYWETPGITYRSGRRRELSINRVKTNPPRIYDDRQFDFRGFYCIVKDGVVTVTDLKRDPDGFDRDGYDEEGYDRNGYNKDGYDREGYNILGYDKDGYDREGYDKDGYDREGYDREGYDSVGRDRDEKNGVPIVNDVYDEEGYDYHNFDRNGIHKVTKLPYDENYFMKDGNNLITGTRYSLTGHNIDGKFNSKRVSSYALRYMYNNKEKGLECVYIARELLTSKFEAKDSIASLYVPSESRNKKVLTEKLYKYVVAAAVLDPEIKELLRIYVVKLLRKRHELKTLVEEEKKKVDKDEDLIKLYKKKISEYNEMIRKTEMGDIYKRNI